MKSRVCKLPATFQKIQKFSESNMNTLLNGDLPSRIFQKVVFIQSENLIMLFLLGREKKLCLTLLIPLILPPVEGDNPYHYMFYMILWEIIHFFTTLQKYVI